MKKTRITFVALALTCAMGLAASSASAAITVGPGAGPWASTISLPSDAFRFDQGGVSWPCGANMAGSLTSTGALTVTSMTQSSCPGTFTFNTPFAGQITGSPGNYAVQIPFGYTYNFMGTCNYSGTLRVGLITGNPIRVSQVTSGSMASSTPGCPSMTIVGSTTTQGSFTPLKAITGSL